MTIFGPILSPVVAEQAVLETLDAWMPEYLREVERQHGLDANALPSVRTYTTKSRFDTIPGDEAMPLVIAISPGLAAAPAKEGDGSYRVKWNIAVALVVSTSEAPRVAAGYYAAAIVAILVHRPSLGGVSSGTDWTGVVFDDIEPEQERTLGMARILFEVEIPDVVAEKRGPRSTDEPRPDPVPPYPEWPKVNDVIIEGRMQ